MIMEATFRPRGRAPALALVRGHDGPARGERAGGRQRVVVRSQSGGRKRVADLTGERRVVGGEPDRGAALEAVVAGERADRPSGHVLATRRRSGACRVGHRVARRDEHAGARRDLDARARRRRRPARSRARRRRRGRGASGRSGGADLVDLDSPGAGPWRCWWPMRSRRRRRRGAAAAARRATPTGASTFGQMRSVTAAASCGERVDLREGERPADPRADLLRADAPALADVLGADQRDRDDRRAGLQREAADTALGAPERARPGAGALGEDQDAVAALEDRPRGLEHVRVAGAAAHREGAERADEPRDEPVLEDLALGDVVDRPAVEHADDERVQERPVVGREDHRPGGRDVLAADAAEPEVEVEERLQDRARDPVDDRVDTALAGPLVQAVELLLARSISSRRLVSPT